MKGYCYVYYSDKPNGASKEYGHPELRIYELERDHLNRPQLGNCVLTIKGQIDQEQHRPYGLDIEVKGQRLKQAKPFLNALERENPGFANYRAVLRMIRKKKLERFVCTRWPEVTGSAYKDIGDSAWIPYRYRRHANLYLQAQETGYSLAKLAGKH